MGLLKKIFDEMGFMDVKTYIQSGNILVKSYGKDKIKLVKKIEEVLFDKLNSKIIKAPMWQNISIRNFNTVKKLYELIVERKNNEK